MINISLKIKNEELNEDLRERINLNFKIDNIDFRIIEDIDSIEELVFIFFELSNDNDLKESAYLKNRKNNNIIFVSKNESLVFKSLEMQPLQFIRLNNIEEDIENCIKVIIKKENKENQVVTFKIGSGTVKLSIEKIIFVESLGHYLTINTESASYRVRGKISNLEKELKNSLIKRVHKSFIVNTNYIKEIYKNTIILTDETEIPIGRMFKENIN